MCMCIYFTRVRHAARAAAMLLARTFRCEPPAASLVGDGERLTGLWIFESPKSAILMVPSASSSRSASPESVKSSRAIASVDGGGSSKGSGKGDCKGASSQQVASAATAAAAAAAEAPKFHATLRHALEVLPASGAFEVRGTRGRVDRLRQWM